VVVEVVMMQTSTTAADVATVVARKTPLLLLPQASPGAPTIPDVGTGMVQFTYHDDHK
jgi:hypothetical protein